jgi:hypothetical protein
VLAAGVNTGVGAEAVAEPGWVAPHLVQNFAPPSRVAPQELQKAMEVTSSSSFLH